MIYDKEKRRNWFISTIDKIMADNKGLSEAEIAKSIDKHPQQFTAMRNGTRPVNDGIIRAIINNYGVQYKPNDLSETDITPESAPGGGATNKELYERLTKLETDLALIKELLLLRRQNGQD